MTAASQTAAPTKAALLVGGLATRLRDQVPDRPKCLVDIRGRPLIDHLLTALSNQGFSRIVLCLGVMADQVRAHLGNGLGFGLKIEYAEEEEPLGTAGALYNARDLLPHPFLCLNGDCLSRIDFRGLVHFFREKQADAAIALVSMPDISEYGSVEIGPDNKVLAFREKQPERRPGLINAGAYVFRPEALWEYAGGPPPVSLEHDVFPKMIADGRPLFALTFEVPFIDIGTPERLAEAQQAEWLE